MFGVSWKSGPGPTDRAFAGRPFDRLDRGADVLPLLIFGHADVDDLAARQTVRNELGVTLLALLDQEGVVVGDGLIESQGWLDAVPVQHRENAEDTNTIAILVVAVAADVGKVVVRRISGPQALGPAHGTHWKWRVGRHLPVPVLEVDNDGKGDTSVVRPSEDGTRDNGGPWIKILIHPVASARRHGFASSMDRSAIYPRT